MAMGTLFSPFTTSTNSRRGFHVLCAAWEQGRVVVAVAVNVLFMVWWRYSRGDGCTLRPVSVTNIKKQERDVMCSGLPYVQCQKLKDWLLLMLRKGPGERGECVLSLSSSQCQGDEGLTGALTPWLRVPLFNTVPRPLQRLDALQAHT